MVNESNFRFWKMAYGMGAIDISMLRQAVVTKENPYGDITEEQFKTISGQDFIVKPVTPVAPVNPTEPTDEEKPVEPTKPAEQDKTDSTEKTTQPQTV
ncbi:MAG: hypothetical protein ACRDBY_05995 [Cetobacterium sp.]